MIIACTYYYYYNTTQIYVKNLSILEIVWWYFIKFVNRPSPRLLVDVTFAFDSCRSVIFTNFALSFVFLGWGSFDRHQHKSPSLSLLLHIPSCSCLVCMSTPSSLWSYCCRNVHAFVKVTFVFRSATLEKCHNSTIVLGTVKTTVNVFGCENVTVIAMCNRLTVR